MSIKQALLSVSDKSGLVEFAQGLSDAGVKLLASGGTAKAIKDAGLPVTSIEDYTRLPSILGGRVKTLHPAIHGGILARDTDEDRATLDGRGWGFIDLVVVNLYPFTQTIAKPDVTIAEAIEQIDIGGVTLLRAAAKNYHRVAVIADPADYDGILAEITSDGSVSDETRYRLAQKAFGHTAAYDSAISGYFNQGDDDLPETFTISFPRAMTLRYGENPHQQAAYYASPETGPLGGELLQGKPLSYNNLLDIDAAWACAADFDQQTVVIVKHLNPTGVASDGDQVKAFKMALASDPVSAFGGIIATNRPFTAETARALGKLFVEAIAAPDFSEEARDILKKRKNCRVLKMKDFPASAYRVRNVRGGLLVQTTDHDEGAEWTVASERQPTDEELSALKFAWRATTHVKSNAIVLVKGQTTVGIGGGLPSRLDSVNLAVIKAGDNVAGSVLASDAFFPFADGPKAAAKAGIVAIVQPGGSIRDQDVIDVINKLGLVMCFTGTRHFKH